MKKRILLLSSACVFSAQALLFGQNLVPNPGFEIQDTCPAVSQIYLAPPWNSATLGTPDLFNSTCAMQNPAARTGIGSAAVYCYIAASPNSREYLQAPLNSPLVAGQGYCVIFYVKRTNYRYATNRFGAYFSEGALSANQTSVLDLTPQVENNPNNMLQNATGWTQISGSFVADGGETHIILGSFANDANTDTLVATPSNSSKVSVYKIDDISVVACAAGVNSLDGINSEISIYPSPASSQLTISNHSNNPITACQIFDLTGKVVMDISENFIDDKIYLNIENIQNGTYVVKLNVGETIVTKRLIVVK